VTAVRDGKQAADLFEAHYTRGDGGRGQTSKPFTCVLMDCQVLKPFLYAETQIIPSAVLLIDGEVAGSPSVACVLIDCHMWNALLFRFPNLKCRSLFKPSKSDEVTPICLSIRREGISLLLVCLCSAWHCTVSILYEIRLRNLSVLVINPRLPHTSPLWSKLDGNKRTGSLLPQEACYQHERTPTNSELFQLSLSLMTCLVPD
jgi:hypothetical protein